MTILTYDPDLSWFDAEQGRFGCWKGGILDGKRTANVSCPKCGQIASLSQHTIEADGTVKPSLVCPYDGCSFHDHVKLKDWKP
jgi:hypothetical protein